MKTHEIHFSLAEAKEFLNINHDTIDKMVSLKKTLDNMGYDIFNHQYFGGRGPNGTGKFPDELEVLIEILRTITDKGIIIKEISRGLMDFPHIRTNGEEVYLCWMHGEDDIMFWHGIEEGFAGRKKISEL